MPGDLLEAENTLAQLASVFFMADPKHDGVSESADGLPDVTEIYRILVEQIPAVVFIAFFDKSFGEAYVSPQIEATLGFTQEEWLNDPVRWYQHIHQEDKDRWSTEVAQMFLTGEPLHSVYRVLSRDGLTIRFQCDVKIVRRSDGHPWFIHGTAFDVTQQQLNDEAMRDYAERMESLSRRLIGVQESERRIIALELHDQIGQILTGLKLKLEMLARSPVEESPNGFNEAPTKPRTLVDMNWDPITRIVGSLGIYTKIDFENREVAECWSTSSIFRGYSIFMKGKDPRDAHFITSRICGICGDNHATCACYAQNMAFGIRPPAIAEWIVNLGEAAEYMFDHNIFQDNLVGVDFCEQMVKETNPGVWEKAKNTDAPHFEDHGYRKISDIMTALNPFTGEFYRETLHVSRYTREMFCLMEGRHVHPSTLYPGGVGTVPTIQLFTDYMVRLMRYCEFMKKCVPLHDDLFDFFYEALPGYEKVGQRRILLGCWGSFNNPDHCDYTYKNMNNWGNEMFVTPGIIVDGKLVTTDLVDINLGIRILLGSSYYDSWEGQEMFVKTDPLGNPVDRNHPWNQTTIPRPQKRNFDDKYTWVMSPRWYHEGEQGGRSKYLALDTGGGAIARLWATALAGKVDIGYIKATGSSVKIYLPKTAMKPEVEFEWHTPKWSNAIERDRARTYFQAYAAAAALHFAEKAMAELHAGNTKTWTEFKVPDEAIGCGFHEAVRGVLSHHVVIRDGKIANYHPYPPTPWNANPRDIYGTPGPYEDAVQNTPIFEENGPDNFKGIDIMRAVRSFDPCLPCGVHMFLGNGKVLETHHSPMFGVPHS